MDFGSKLMHPYTKGIYDMYSGFQHTSLKSVKGVMVHYSSVGFTKLVGFPYADHLLDLHRNLDQYHSLYRIILLITLPFVLIVGINIHYILDFFLLKD